MKENRPHFEKIAEETFHLEQEGGEREEVEDTDSPQGVFFKNHYCVMILNVL